MIEKFITFLISIANFMSKAINEEIDDEEESEVFVYVYIILVLIFLGTVYLIK